MKYKMTIYPVILLTILYQSASVSSFLLKCETIAEAANNDTHVQELLDTVTANDGASITTHDNYKITNVGVHKIHKTAETWNEARNICLDEKAHLAVINSAAEEALIIKYMREQNIGSMWIGVHDLFERNQWTTVTGERLYSLDYVHWSKDEPNNVGSVEHCVNMSQMGMNDLLCTRQLYFLCEKMKFELNHREIESFPMTN